MDIKTYLERLKGNEYVKLFPVRGGSCELKGYVRDILSDKKSLAQIEDLTFNQEYIKKDNVRNTYRIVMFDD